MLMFYKPTTPYKIKIDVQLGLAMEEEYNSPFLP